MTESIDVEALDRRYANFKPDQWDGDDYDELIQDLFVALRQQQVEIKNLIRDFCSETEVLGEMNVEVQRLEAVIEEAQAPAKEMQWISVDERLPEKMAPVLVHSDRDLFGKWSSCCIAQWWDYHNGPLWHDSFNGEWMIHNVTHWMPLPEVPK